MEYFQSFKNEDFARYIINDDNTDYGRQHRLGFYREIVRFGERYYCLDKNSAVKCLMAALGDVYMDMKLNRIETNSINLHEEAFIRCRREFFDLKRKQILEAREARVRNEDMNRFLFGDEYATDIITVPAPKGY